MSEYYCKRIKQDISAERNYDNGAMVVHCHHYTSSPFGENKRPCFFDKLFPKYCFVRKPAEKKEPDEKSKLTK